MNGIPFPNRPGFPNRHGFPSGRPQSNMPQFPNLPQPNRPQLPNGPSPHGNAGGWITMSGEEAMEICMYGPQEKEEFIEQLEIGASMRLVIEDPMNGGVFAFRPRFFEHFPGASEALGGGGGGMGGMGGIGGMGGMGGPMGRMGGMGGGMGGMGGMGMF